MVECMRRSEVRLVFFYKLWFIWLGLTIFPVSKCLNYFLQKFSTHSIDISTNHFQFRNTICFAFSSVWSVSYMTRCLFVLASFKCWTPTSFICTATGSGSFGHFLIRKFVIPESHQVFKHPPLWKGELFQISLFVASWRLQLVNDLGAWVTTTAVVKDLPAVWQTRKSMEFENYIALCTLEVEDKHVWESI